MVANDAVVTFPMEWYKLQYNWRAGSLGHGMSSKENNIAVGETGSIVDNLKAGGSSMRVQYVGWVHGNAILLDP